MMERMIKQCEAFTPDDPELAALKADLKNGHFRTLDDYKRFTGTLLACDLDLFDSNRISNLGLSTIQDLDRKEKANA